jgi:hypothetical protein
MTKLTVAFFLNWLHTGLDEFLKKKLHMEIIFFNK